MALGELALDGTIAAVAGVLPAAIAANALHRGVICPAASGPEAAWASGDMKRFQVARDLLAPLAVALFVETNPIPVKWALSRLGLIHEDLRLPLTPLSRHCEAPLHHALDGILSAEADEVARIRSVCPRTCAATAA